MKFQYAVDLRTSALTLGQQQEVLSSGTVKEIVALTSNRNLHPQIAAKMATEHEFRVKAALAQRFTTAPLDVLLTLARDEDVRVLEHLASSRGVKVEVERVLRKGPLPVRGKLARNTRVSEETQLWLVDNIATSGPAVNVLAVNSGLTPRAQRHLYEKCRESRSYVFSGLAKNEKLLPELQEHLSFSSDRVVKWSLVRNPSFVHSEKLSARFVWEYCRAYYEDEASASSDREILDSLVPSWEGSLQALLQAPSLVR